MLEDIIFDGCFVTESSFKEINFGYKNGGSFELTTNNSVELTEVNKITENSRPHTSNCLQSTVKASLSAENLTDTEKKEPAFEINVEFTMFFTIPSSKEHNMTKEFLEQHKWFFDNYAHHELTRILKSIIAETRFKGIAQHIPLGRMK